MLSRRRAARNTRAALSSWSVRIATCAILSVALITLAFPTAPAARAVQLGGSQPIIHWAANMITPVQNNGNPWGPVGELTTVNGENFTPNVQLRLVLAPGDSNTDATLCQQPGVTVISSTVFTNSTGRFGTAEGFEGFYWPAAANQVNQGYSICSVLASDHSLASSHDDGPFTVQSASPPAIEYSRTNVAAGGTVIFTGQNWVPPQQVLIDLTGCSACSPRNGLITIGSVTSTGLNSGTFQIAIVIPRTIQPANYTVDALAHAPYLEAYNDQILSIFPGSTTPTLTPTPLSSPLPGPSPTSSAIVPSATPAASATTRGASGTVATTSNGSGGTTGTAGDTSESGILIALICVALGFFLVAAVICVMLLLRRKRAGHAAQDPPYYSAPQAGQFGQPGQVGQSNLANNPSPFFAQPGASPVPAEYFTPLPSSPLQQSAMASPYGQSPHLPTCPNCGRSLVPNLPACSVCGMPQSAMRW